MGKISVIMPCFNAAGHISESVGSVLGQSYEAIELIVVNDDSTDHSLQVLEGIRDYRLVIISQPHSGVCVARNRGLAEATGDYVAFLDADDTWRPDCLEKLHSVLQKSPDAALAYCGWQNVGLPGGRGQPFIPADYEQPAKVEILLGGNRWPIHAALTRREAVIEAGGFDERFRISEDYHLWLRIATRHPIVRVPEVLAYYHFHEGTQATKDRVRGAFDHWQVQREFLRERPDIASRLGNRRIRELTHGELLRRGYICYWNRDLESARTIFRRVMKTGYGTVTDWKYMLPALLPLPLNRLLIQFFSKKEEKA